MGVPSHGIFYRNSIAFVIHALDPIRSLDPSLFTQLMVWIRQSDREGGECAD